jgi:epoxyqueuosine reductase
MRGAASPTSRSSTRGRSRANSASIGNRIYGCDDCLAVCPWNKFAQEGARQKLAARDDLAHARSPISRGSTMPASARFRRVAGQAHRGATASCATCWLRSAIRATPVAGAGEARRLLDDGSPLVRGAAVWALSQLIERDAFAALASRADGEPDITVQQEWRTAAAS